MNSPTTDPVYFLLVDDLEENLVALRALLRREGLVMLEAHSGSEALEMLLKYEVALALVDVQMPDMDGFELAELMRGTERTRRVPIIFLTAGSDQQRRFRGYEAGAVDFLQKPIEPDILRGKAAVFFELFRQRQEVARQRDELHAATIENARLLEESRRNATALREADIRKDEFLATLAHELRNPLAPIRHGLEVLRTASDQPQAAQVREIMDRQLAHMVRLIDDLLDVSRISLGKLVLKRQRVSIQDIVASAVEASRPLIDSARHTLAVDVPTTPILLDADFTRLSQVVSNLLNNAAKYTPEGGKIDLVVQATPTEVVIRVTDTGVGISQEMLPSVFELFTQVGRTIDRAQGGLGIGLSLVKRILELHGGAIRAESAGLGRGSTFIAALPLSWNAAAVQTPADPAPPAATAPRRVLVVDDNLDGAQTLALMLKLTGHTAQTAHDGPTALAAAAAFRPEVVFLDIGMPGMNGYEVASRFRKDPTLAGVVLVALTGWGSEDDKERARSAGFDHHLTKPVDVKRMTSLLVNLRSRDSSST